MAEHGGGIGVWTFLPNGDSSNEILFQGSQLSWLIFVISKFLLASPASSSFSLTDIPPTLSQHLLPGGPNPTQRVLRAGFLWEGELFFFFWLRWVFVAVRGLSLVVASGGYSSLWSTGSRCTGSRCTGFSSCRS